MRGPTVRPAVPTKVISELDIYVANLAVERHGGDAFIEAVRMVDGMLELGDPEGRALSQRIRRAIEMLQTEKTSERVQ